jgi:hypothetical protein
VLNGSADVVLRTSDGSMATAVCRSQASISCKRPYELRMTTEKIYVDASQPAVLRHLGGTFACQTLGEAMIAWDEIPDKGDATQDKASTSC